MTTTPKYSLTFPITHAILQMVLIYLFLTQFALFNGKAALCIGVIVAVIVIPPIFFKKTTGAILTNSFTRMCLLVLLILSICLNAFLLFHWIFSNHEIGPDHKLFPWVLTDELGSYAGASYDTIINPLVFGACCITFFSAAIFMLDTAKAKMLKLFSIISCLLQILFITLLFIFQRPSFMG
ncbi:hypothetical protein BH11BAC7_BH11BAC7_11440 [soil metagenome]